MDPTQDLSCLFPFIGHMNEKLWTPAFCSFRQRSSNIYLMSELHLSDNEASLTSCPVCMLSHVSALPAMHWTCSMAYWHAHMQNIAYCRQSSAVAPALGVPKQTHTGRGIFKCTDNMYGKQHNVVQLGAIKKSSCCAYNRRHSETGSSIVVGYANYETTDITLDIVTLIKQHKFTKSQVTRCCFINLQLCWVCVYCHLRFLLD